MFQSFQAKQNTGGLLKMDFISSPAFEVVDELPRELKNNELLGRRFYTDLKNVKIPTLVIGAKHDTMDPKHMDEISKILPNGSYLFCPKGSHMAFYDDQKTYFNGLISFLKK